MPPRPPEDPLDDTLVMDETAPRKEIVHSAIPPRRSPRLWPWLLALGVLVLVGLLAYLLLSGGDARTTVPGVVGLTEAQARSRLAEADLEAAVDRQPSRRKAGIAVAQSPAAGVEVDQGQRVQVVVSSGLTSVSVPDVVDLEEAAAVEEGRGGQPEAQARAGLRTGAQGRRRRPGSARRRVRGARLDRHGEDLQGPKRQARS